MLHLGVALNQRQAGDAAAARAAADEALRLVADGGEDAGFVGEEARELIETLEAAELPVAVNE